jgi:hypothetical protein
MTDVKSKLADKMEDVIRIKQWVDETLTDLISMFEDEDKCRFCSFQNDIEAMLYSLKESTKNLDEAIKPIKYILRHEPKNPQTVLEMGNP